MPKIKVLELFISSYLKDLIIQKLHAQNVFKQLGISILIYQTVWNRWLP